MSSSAGYADQKAWKQLQEFLPASYRLIESADLPEESVWPWRENLVHVERYRNPQAPVRLLLLHGVGTNARQLTLVAGKPLADRGLDVTAIDNLGYGMTQTRHPHGFGYADWVDLVVDFIESERVDDPRPIVLLGLSAGGLLGYHVAAKTPVAGVAGLTFLDQRDQLTRDATAHDKLISRVGAPAARLATRLGFGWFPMPMRVASKMSALLNDPKAMHRALRDRSSAGNRVPLRFLSSYLRYTPAIEPEDFRGCPILLVQPAEDRWSPRILADRFLRRIQHVPVTYVNLAEAGHLPIEEPGLTQLADAVNGFARNVAAGRIR